MLRKHRKENTKNNCVCWLLLLMMLVARFDTLAMEMLDARCSVCSVVHMDCVCTRSRAREVKNMHRAIESSRVECVTTCLAKKHQGNENNTHI